MKYQKDVDRVVSSLNDGNIAIIVEGIRDEKALVEVLGIKKDRIFVYNSASRNAETLAYKISGVFDEVVILTDFDRAGRRIYDALDRNLRSLNVKTDYHLRDQFFRVFLKSSVENVKLPDDYDPTIDCRSMMQELSIFNSYTDFD